MRKILVHKADTLRKALVAKTYAKSRERSGFFVIFRQTDGFAAAEIIPEIHSQHAMKPPEYTEFPASVLSRIMRKVISDRNDELLEKSPNGGCDELRSTFLRSLSAAAY